MLLPFLLFAVKIPQLKALVVFSEFRFQSQRTFIRLRDFRQQNSNNSSYTITFSPSIFLFCLLIYFSDVLHTQVEARVSHCSLIPLRTLHEPGFSPPASASELRVTVSLSLGLQVCADHVQRSL